MIQNEVQPDPLIIKQIENEFLESNLVYKKNPKMMF